MRYGFDAGDRVRACSLLSVQVTILARIVSPLGGYSQINKYQTGVELVLGMFNCSVTNKVIFVLLLTMLMAWVGHTSALFTPTNQHMSTGAEHSHDDEAAPDTNATPLYAGHVHTSCIADHVHEPPHPNAQLVLTFQPERIAPVLYPDTVLPNEPVSRIERPPRFWL